MSGTALAIGALEPNAVPDTVASPRRHESEDHPEVGDSLVGHRDWQTGREIPVEAQVVAVVGVTLVWPRGKGVQPQITAKIP